jgi:hypothetical protein
MAMTLLPGRVQTQGANCDRSDWSSGCALVSATPGHCCDKRLVWDGSLCHSEYSFKVNMYISYLDKSRDQTSTPIDTLKSWNDEIECRTFDCRFYSHYKPLHFFPSVQEISWLLNASTIPRPRNVKMIQAETHRIGASRKGVPLPHESTELGGSKPAQKPISHSIFWRKIIQLATYFPENLPWIEDRTPLRSGSWSWNSSHMFLTLKWGSSWEFGGDTRKCTLPVCHQVSQLGQFRHSLGQPGELSAVRIMKFCGT